MEELRLINELEKIMNNKEYAKQIYLEKNRSISQNCDNQNCDNFYLPDILKIKVPQTEDELNKLFQKNYDSFIQEQKDLIRRYEAWSQNPQSGIPERYKDASFFNFEVKTELQEAIRQKVIDFVDRPRNDGVLILTGPKGTGKTHLGTAAARATLGHYANMEDIIHQLNSSQNFRAKKTEEEVYDFYTTVNFLVIDEIGRALKQDRETEILGYLLRKRYDNRRPTLLITNLSKNTLLEKMGEAVMDRLFETGDCIEFSGESFRIGKRKRETVA